MSLTEDLNTAASAYAAAGGAAFVALYGVLAPWHRSPVGRMIMSLAAGITGLMVVVVLVFFTRDVGTARIIRSVLAVMIGTSLWRQAFMVIRAQLSKRRSS